MQLSRLVVKQFWVEENKFYDFDKLPLDRGDIFSLNQILLVNQNDSVQIGKPFLDSEFTVKAKVLRNLSGPKIRVYKMRPKKKTRKTFGHRRKLTRVLITSISKK
jgi:ribosomal protein L21